MSELLGHLAEDWDSPEDAVYDQQPQWHVYYRTIGMSARNQKGWARADILADTMEAAVEQLRQRKHRLQHIRVYPGAAAWVAEFEWEPTNLRTKHDPHPVDREEPRE